MSEKRQFAEGDGTTMAANPSRDHVSHLSVLRAARLRHKAIARGLQRYFDAVAAEKIPAEFFEILNRADSQPQAV